MNQIPSLDPSDQPVANRLAKLHTMPVDTTRIDAVLETRIPRPRRVRTWLKHPIRAAVAAVLALALCVGIIMATSGGPVLAEASQMAQMHQDIVANRIQVMKADSIAEAEKVLAQQWSGPDAPGVPEAHVMACCMKSIKNRKVACVLLKSEDKPITMSVASAADFKTPQGQGVQRHGFTYHVQCAKAVNMVSTQRNGRWICLISELPSDRLIDIASKLHF